MHSRRLTPGQVRQLLSCRSLSADLQAQFNPDRMDGKANRICGSCGGAFPNAGSLRSAVNRDPAGSVRTATQRGACEPRSDIASTSRAPRWVAVKRGRMFRIVTNSATSEQISKRGQTMTDESISSGSAAAQHPAAAADFLPIEPLRQRQAERLQATVRLAFERVAWYRQRFAAAGVTADQIRTPDDLVRLPFVTKEDLRAAYPQGLFAVPLDQVARLHASSGTTGRQVLVPYTRPIWQSGPRRWSGRWQCSESVPRT
jgi:hypothetical protein